MTNGEIVITASSNTAVITTGGIITPPSAATSITLTLKVTGNGAIVEGKQVTVSVPARSSGSSSSGSSKSNSDSSPAAALSIDAGKFGKMVFNNNALSAIVNAGKGDVRIIAAEISDSTKLTDEQKAAVGNNPVYDFGVYVGDTRVSEFGSGSVTISLPYTPKSGENMNGIVIYYVDAYSNLQMIQNGIYDAKTGTISFTVNHFSLYMIGYNYKTFTDIALHWGKNAVEFSASRGLVSGVGNGMYEPYREVKRCEFVQMVWNVMQLPDGRAAEFADVKADAWYYKSIMATKAVGLLDGLLIDSNNFDPDRPITREEMAVIMANAAKYKGKKLPADTGDLDAMYADTADITKEYKERVWQTISCGLMIGSNASGGKMQFTPKTTATRAEAAQNQANILDVLK